MADVLTEDERAAIEAAIAEGRVYRCKPGASAFEYVPSPQTGQLVLVNRLAEEMGRATRNSWGKRMASQQEGAARRRKRVRALHAEGLTTSAITKKLNAVAATIKADLQAMGLRGNPPGGAGRQVPEDERPDANERQRQIPRLIARGLSKPDMARHLRVTIKTIYRDLEALEQAGAL